MEKYFEVRDHGTCMPVLAIQFDPTTEKIRWMLGMTGYGISEIEQRKYIVLIKLVDGQGRCEPYDWATDWMREVHEAILREFDNLDNGQVVDLRVYRGEATANCESDYREGA